MRTCSFAGQSACYPWAHSITFGPTLTVGWIGDFAPARQGRHLAFVELWADIGERADPRDRSNLSGNATLCDARGERRQFGVSGQTHDWRGTRFSMTTFLSDHYDGRGIQLGNSEGEWDKRDAIRLNARLLLLLIRNGGSISTTARSPEQVALEDTPVVFTLKRGNAQEFQSACRALAR